MTRGSGGNRKMYGSFSNRRMTRKNGLIKSPAMVRSKAAGQVKR